MLSSRRCYGGVIRARTVVAATLVTLAVALGLGPGLGTSPGEAMAVLAGIGASGGRVPLPEAETERKGLVLSELPLTPGTLAEYACNDLSSPGTVAVDFSLVGPWDFSDGPKFKLLNTIIPLVEAPEAHRFPMARLVARSEAVSLKGNRSTTYTFMSVERAGLCTWGSVYVTSGYPSSYEVYYDREHPDNPAAYRFLLPLSGGDVWEDSVNVETVDERYHLTVRHSVIGQGTVTVPAGTFRCLLVKQEHTVSQEGQPNITQLYYYWTSPEVGDVVVVGSLPNEKETRFKKAPLFARLVRFERGR